MATGRPTVPQPQVPDSASRGPQAGLHPDRSRSWLRRAAPIVLSRRWLFGSALGAALLSLLLGLQLPKVLNGAVNHALVARDAPLSHFVWEAGALALGTAALGLAARQLLMRVAYGLEFDFRNLVYGHLTRLSAAFYDSHQSGQLLSRASSDIRTMQMYLAFGPFVIVQCLGAAIAFGFMLTIDVPLALVTMVTIPLVGWTTTRMQRALLPASWLVQTRLADVATVVDESVSGVGVVKAFAAEEREVDALTRAAQRLRWAQVKDADVRARLAPVAQNLPQLGMVSLLVLGGWRVVHGELEVGAILAFSSYVFLLQAPFQMLGNLVMMGQLAAASAGRVFELLDAEPVVRDRAGAVELVHTAGDVVFDDVSFSYGDGPTVLQGFDLRLRRGEVVALVGRSGSGKSTVARLLTRSYDVDGGSITLDGHDLRDLTLSSVRAAVNVVMEEPFLFSASIRDNISYAVPGASLSQVQAAAHAAGAADFVADLPQGYDTVVGERGSTLSGGQRQRVALARCLLAAAPVLVLDDATSSLDVEVEAAVHAALAERLPDSTVLVIAHRLSTISMADRVVVLDGGRIVANGTHEGLLATSAVYAEVLAQAHAHEAHEDDVVDVPELGVDEVVRGLAL